MTQTKLTDEEIDAIQEECDCHGCDSCDIRIHEFARAIESAVLSRTTTDDEWMEEAEHLAGTLAGKSFQHGYACRSREDDSYNEAMDAEVDAKDRARNDARAALLAHLRRRPAPATERTPQDYAIEHADYLAQQAEALLAAINARDAAYAVIEEIETDRTPTDDEREQYMRTIEAQNEHAIGLRECIYEFRKRRDRAAALGVQPSDGGQR